jgi:hypothetical protein
METIEVVKVVVKLTEPADRGLPGPVHVEAAGQTLPVLSRGPASPT